jgi:hypothetical protein
MLCPHNLKFLQHNMSKWQSATVRMFLLDGRLLLQMKPQKFVSVIRQHLSMRR